MRFSSSEGSKLALGRVARSTGPKQASGGSVESVLGGCIGVNTFLKEINIESTAAKGIEVTHVASFPPFFNITPGPPG